MFGFDSCWKFENLFELLQQQKIVLGFSYSILFILLYGDWSFGMYIHHGGQFGSFDDAIFYVGGHLVLKLELDVDRFLGT